MQSFETKVNIAKKNYKQYQGVSLIKIILLKNWKSLKMNR